MKRIDVFKRTHDNWYPSYGLGNSGEDLVAVSLTQTGPNPPENGEWRVCAWGADDMGMEIDFANFFEAQSMFDEVISLEFVDIEILKELGFISA